MSEKEKCMTDRSTDRLTYRIKNTIKKRPKTPPIAKTVGNDSLPVSRENIPDLRGEAAPRIGLFDNTRNKKGRTTDLKKTITEQQLEQIAALRRENYPYSFIGWVLGLSPNTVKSICQRQGFAASGARKTKAEKQNAPLCRYYHKPLPETKRRGARFCSDYCRTKWYRANRKVIEIKT